ncbi:hypothetical protein DFH08DRAFT_830626 [Mycena albidolilacea]|uniref:Uncharacterized protein n=1 Tax=Mycena albidolilacea TaxID=1033008 RepID=A0AAD7AUA0_9AGAR|nr:hypothetical protein DFH08DRAFT_830626 [Mycena albidolilacea]
MCYASGSIDQAVNVCPMCKVFPHTSCPHTREVCRNRTAHPRFDVLYLKNAEVDSFNGCGYCKWARTNPPPKAAGYFNTGWPGCCRAPTTSEHRLIQPADWRSVSQVHHVPIPSDVKAALDRATGSPLPSTSPVRSATKAAMPLVDSRRNSTSGRSSAKSAAVPIPTKGRSGGSPQMVASSVTSTSSRGSGSSGGTSGSVPNASSIDQARKPRDSEKPRSSNSSPSRKHVDSDNAVTPRRNSVARQPSKVVPEALISGRRRSNSSTQPPASTKAVSPKSSPTVRPVDAPKPQKKEKADIENSAAVSGSDPPRSQKKKDPETSSTSSSGSESMTESTVTSTGEFTDYLSDESEAELQRQAEAKAALVAQNEAEEMEFRAARQALANIGLRPPKSWAATDTTRSAARLAPSTRS